MLDFHMHKSNLLAELKIALDIVDEEQVASFINAILAADTVFLIGVGRVQLSLLSFCKRLNHLGIKAFAVGAINEPRFTPNDLLIVGSRSGKTLYPLSIAQKAKELGGKLGYIGAAIDGFIYENADYRISLKSFGVNTDDSRFKSGQLMASLFEQTILLLGDLICKMIVEKENLDVNVVNYAHANLE